MTAKKKNSPAEAVVPQEHLVDVTFEMALDELEAIVAQLEGGQLGLSDSLASYEKGVKFLRHCYLLLENAEKRIAVLSGHDADGRPVVEPFYDESTDDLDQKARSRSTRRTARQQPSSGSQNENRRRADDVDLPEGLF